MSGASVTPQRRNAAVRRTVLALILTAGAVVPGAAGAETHARGFVPPPDYERILADHLVVYPLDKDPLPSNYDWREHNGTTPVKNQADCGSCWAFAATAEMESKIRIYYHELLDLSEQQIVSCNPYGSGCNGGWAGAAYYIFMHVGGILEGCMPYEASDAVPCSQDQYLKFTDIDNWVSVMNNLDQIKTAIYTNGPVCTSVDANDAWDGYSGGVITAPGSGTNHLVLIVGWDDRMGAGGAWVVKNSWGAGWGDSGYCYVAYGACNIGTGVTSLNYTPPPVKVTVAVPDPDVLYYGDADVTVQWNTANETVGAVDLYYGTDGACQTELIAADVPNTGSYLWTLPNVTTDRATVVVFPSEGTYRGFGFTAGEFAILGHQTRYVSPAGSDTPPYDAPAKAAHSLADAVLAGAGRDTVLVTGGDYLESGITVNSQCHVIGGWNAAFTVCDPDAYPTRLRGVNGTLRFGPTAYDYCGVSGITFHDCQAALGAVPVNGRHGAAIVAVGASPVIERCRFENNRAEPAAAPGWGGAILAHGGAPVIRDCTFVGNVGSHGGAVALSASTGGRLESCDFFRNATSDSTASYPGAAVYVAGGAVTIEDCELRGGGAGVGGGLAVADGAVVTARDLTIADNRAGAGGAGVHASAADLTLERARITGNTCWTGAGGGLYLAGGQVTLGNLLVAGNAAPSLGGGLYTQDLAGGAIRNCVLHGNSGLNTGGGFVVASGPVAIFNNLATGNTGGGWFFSGAGIDADWNLAFANSGANFGSGLHDHDVVADPRYVDAPSGDFAPGLHSPLLDSGSPAAGSDWDGSPADRGLHGGATGLAGGPAAVAGLEGSVAAGVVSLSWTAVDGAATYAVYRDTADVFVPDPARLCATVTAPDCVCEDTPPAGAWYYVVGAVDADGHAGGFSARYAASGGSTPVGDGGLPTALAITGVAPNPFNPRVTVTFAVPRTGPVRLGVFDLRGRLIRSLHDGPLAAGRHAAVWNGDDAQGRSAAAGVYFVRLDDGGQAAAVKIVLAK